MGPEIDDTGAHQFYEKFVMYLNVVFVLREQIHSSAYNHLSYRLECPLFIRYFFNNKDILLF